MSSDGCATAASVYMMKKNFIKHYEGHLCPVYQDFNVFFLCVRSRVTVAGQQYAGYHNLKIFPVPFHVTHPRIIKQRNQP